MPLIIPAALLLFIIYVSFKRVMEYERLVVFFSENSKRSKVRAYGS